MQAGAVGRAHWTLFAPAVLVGVTYGLLWALLALLGRGDGVIARTALIVFSLGTPLLLMYGFLRFNSVWITAAEGQLWMARGWPRITSTRIPLDEIDRIALAQSFIGRWFNVGEIVVHLHNGRQMKISDIGAPGAVRQRLHAELMRSRGMRAP
ncbi:MAG: hypothetical protein C0605_10255 [Hyphomicrobiales bacterium]|nr:MAG: hypothetical protein C0605_10255 [Hyphomicrobiales bacterium]